MNNDINLEVATLAGGCFWCTEAVFSELKGVEKIIPGYIGGKTINPTYNEICNGDTDHAEAVQISFNPKVVSYVELLELFFATHDPTTLNRQGYDIGTQYRSEIFYHNEEQKVVAESFIRLLTEEAVFEKPVVTKITAVSTFYEAEDYHHNYYDQNKSQAYCAFVIAPKIDKVRTYFKDKLKE